MVLGIHHFKKPPFDWQNNIYKYTYIYINEFDQNFQSAKEKSIYHRILFTSQELLPAFLGPQFQLPKDVEVVSPTTKMPRNFTGCPNWPHPCCSELVSLWSFKSFKRKSQKLISWNWGYGPMASPCCKLFKAKSNMACFFKSSSSRCFCPATKHSTPPFIGDVPLPWVMTQRVTAPKIEMPESSITQSLPGDSPSRSWNRSRCVHPPHNVKEWLA